MQTHEPREDFVNRLESALVAEARRRNQTGAPGWTPRWLMLSPARVAAAIAAIVIVSMVAGGAVVAAAYRIEQNERRDQIAATYERKLEVAEAQLGLARKTLERQKRLFEVGLINNVALLDDEYKVVEAERDVTILKLQIEEIRLSGQQPLSTISAPLVNGRDFVRLRWETDLQAPEKALVIERIRHDDTQRRIEIGIANPSEIQNATARLSELAASINVIKRKIEIRRRFVNKEIDATQADLLGLEAEAIARFQTLTSQIETAKREYSLVRSRFEKGLVDELEVKRAELKVMNLQTDAGQVELEIAVIKRRLKGKD